MNELQIFTNSEFGEIRTITESGVISTRSTVTEPLICPRSTEIVRFGL